jgi:hypothetical protein
MIPSTRSDLIRDSVRRIEVASLLALIGLVLFSSNASPLALERPPYLQMGTASGIVVRWRTDTPTDTRLRYGASPGVLDSLVSIPGNRTEHEVALGGLSPDTRYYYDVGHEAGVLAGGDPHHFFRTSPQTGEKKHSECGSSAIPGRPMRTPCAFVTPSPISREARRPKYS